VPRDFAVYPRDFGRRAVVEWRTPDGDWTPRERAQLDASKLQNQICFGVVERYLPSSDIRSITGLAQRLGVEYDRLQKVLSGRMVMQFEDVGRLRAVVGPQLDYWMLRGPSAELFRAWEIEQCNQAQGTSAVDA
jgi:plasmid maintenance system antidote protein VapI